LGRPQQAVSVETAVAIRPRQPGQSPAATARHAHEGGQQQHRLSSARASANSSRRKESAEQFYRAQPPFPPGSPAIECSCSVTASTSGALLTFRQRGYRHAEPCQSRSTPGKLDGHVRLHPRRRERIAACRRRQTRRVGGCSSPCSPAGTCCCQGVPGWPDAARGHAVEGRRPELRRPQSIHDRPLALESSARRSRPATQAFVPSGAIFPNCCDRRDQPGGARRGLQSACWRRLQERKVTIGQGDAQAPAPFLVIATQGTRGAERHVRAARGAARPLQALPQPRLPDSARSAEGYSPRNMALASARGKRAPSPATEFECLRGRPGRLDGADCFFFSFFSRRDGGRFAPRPRQRHLLEHVAGGWSTAPATTRPSSWGTARGRGSPWSRRSRRGR